MTKNNTKKELVVRMDTLMKEQELYKDPNLSLDTVSRLLGVTRNRLSRAVNIHLGMRFTTYVNRYRVHEVVRLITNLENASVSVLSLYRDAGFASSATFYVAFREAMGVTPNAFKQQVLLLASKRLKKAKTPPKK
jgi:AraC-like DNA-binding protein